MLILTKSDNMRLCQKEILIITFCNVIITYINIYFFTGHNLLSNNLQFYNHYLFYNL